MINKWEFYETFGPIRWRINNSETGVFFLSETEKEAQWLTEVLNCQEEEIKYFDEGFFLTEDGDIMKASYE
jgi:hypothetical protein